MPVSTPFASKSLPVATRSSPSRASVAPNARPSADEPRFEIPVGRGAERQALLFAIDDQPDGDALHAAGAQAGLDLLPQHRRQRVAVEPIEDAAALLRADQVLVDVVRVLDGLPIAFSVISWKTMRLTGTFGFSTSSRCQLIDSPSRSGSVASKTATAPLSAAFSAWTCFRLSFGTT